MWEALTALTAALIGGGINIWDQNQKRETEQTNAYNQQVANLTNQGNAWNAEVRSREQAVQDFNAQNRYNDPKQQMIRLGEAGLNPHLVYGGGATTTAAQIRGANTQAPRVDAPHLAPMDFSKLASAPSNIVGGYYQMKQAEQRMDYTDVKIANEVTKGQATQQQIKQKNELFDSSLANAKARARETQASAALKELDAEMVPLKFGLQQQQFELQKAKTSKEIQSITQDIIRKTWENTEFNPVKRQALLQQLEIMNSTGAMKEIELALSRMGIAPSSPWYVKILAQWSEKLRNEFQVDTTQKEIRNGLEVAPFKSKVHLYQR